jgi:hypothetical protein
MVQRRPQATVCLPRDALLRAWVENLCGSCRDSGVSRLELAHGKILAQTFALFVSDFLEIWIVSAMRLLLLCGCLIVACFGPAFYHLSKGNHAYGTQT